MFINFRYVERNNKEFKILAIKWHGAQINEETVIQ